MNNFWNLCDSSVLYESTNSYVVHKNNSTIIVEEVPCLINKNTEEVCYSDKIVEKLRKLVDILTHQHYFKLIVVNYADAVNHYL